MYLDANNLYGWVMCQPLLVSNFVWVKPADKLLDDILRLPDEQGTRGGISMVSQRHAVPNNPFMSE